MKHRPELHSKSWERSDTAINLKVQSANQMEKSGRVTFALVPLPNHGTLDHNVYRKYDLIREGLHWPKKISMYWDFHRNIVDQNHFSFSREDTGWANTYKGNEYTTAYDDRLMITSFHRNIYISRETFWLEKQHLWWITLALSKFS